MLQASVKEYELLCTEVQNIKDCITKYVGYIIGANGIAYIIFGTVKSNPPRTDTKANATSQLNELISADVVLIVVITLVTAIYYILNYKFASHNRYIGYQQLLSQEIYHVNVIVPKTLENPDLETGYTTERDQDLKIPENIFAWDYISSKWHNRTKTKQYPKKYYNKLDLRLQLPSDYTDFSVPHLKADENVIHLFFRNIIWGGFNVAGNNRFYNKFIVRSWRYPKHVFLLTAMLTLLSLLSLTFFSNLSILPIIFIDMLFGAIWIYFAVELFRLLTGNKTIDYYCWAFLSFRTKLLNNYKIRPVYHSTSFQRYFKSLKMAELIKQNETAIIKSQNTSRRKFDSDDVGKIIKEIIKGMKLNKNAKGIINSAKQYRK